MKRSDLYYEIIKDIESDYDNDKLTWNEYVNLLDWIKAKIKRELNK